MVTLSLSCEKPTPEFSLIWNYLDLFTFNYCTTVQQFSQLTNGYTFESGQLST